MDPVNAVLGGLYIRWLASSDSMRRLASSHSMAHVLEEELMAGIARRLAVPAVLLSSVMFLTGIEAPAQPKEDAPPRAAFPLLADASVDAPPERVLASLGNTLFRDGDGGWAVAFAPDGSHIVTLNWAGTIRFWDAASGREQGALSAHGVDGTHRLMALSKDGRRLAAVGTFLGGDSSRCMCGTCLRASQFR